MKMTELKCTACNGTLKIDQDNPHIAICEYCQTKYVIEDEGNNQVHLNPASPSKAPSVDWYTPRQPLTKTTKKKATGWEPYGWKRGVTLVVVGIVLAVAVNFKGISRRWKMDHQDVKTTVASQMADAGKGSSEKEASGEAAPSVPFEGAFAAMAELALDKPAADITEEELASFKWIATKYSSESFLIGYSFENPAETEDAELEWVAFSRDSTRPDMAQLGYFTGLKYLDVASSVPGEVLNQLSLYSLGCYAKTPAALAELMGDKAAELKELKITASLENLTGIGSFTGLESLSLDGYKLTDIKDLASMKWLKSLTLENCDDITDFSVLSVMTWLQSLSVESEAIRDIGFIAQMPELTSFALMDASVLNVNGLSQAQQLTSLTIEDCGEMKDCNAISGMTGLLNLTLEIPYGCAEPDLSGLSQLTSLSISRVENISFLNHMPALENLTMSGCQINDTGVFAALTNLKTLACSNIYGELSNWNFVSRIPALEVLNLNGVGTYEDISVLFTHPTIRELYLNGVECELNFAKLQPNETLTVLEMAGMKFYTNVQISGGGGIYSINYDNVTLDEHTDFLRNYPGLKTLRIGENKLTNLAFAESLTALEILDIRDNYVTDLKPLASLTALKTVDCTGNPVENYRVLGEDVMIIK